MKAESHDESHGSHDEGDSPAPPSGGNINLETHNIPATLPSTISMDAQQQLAQARLNALSRIIEFRTRNVSGAREQALFNLSSAFIGWNAISVHAWTP